MAQGFEGRIYPTFMLDYESVCMQLATGDPEIEVIMNCYPRVVHAIKASQVTANIQCINKGVKYKL